MKRLMNLLKKLSGRKEEAKTREQLAVTKITKPVGVRITVRDVFTAFSLSFFEPAGRWLARTFELEKQFTRAGMNIHPVKYGAETVSLVMIAAVFCTLGFITMLLTTRLTLVETIVGATITVTAPIMVFVLRLARPYTATLLRKSETENELPFFMSYVATMVRGGYSLERVIERATQLKVFKAVREEARRIVTRIKMMGEDPATALEKVALHHPSTRFRDIMLGYITTLRSGGDVVHYLEVRTRELVESRIVEIRNTIGRLMSFLEVYTIFGVVVSITLFVFFAVSAAITAAQVARTPEGLTVLNVDVTTPAIYNFFFLPLLGSAITLAVHVNQPRTPVRYGEVYLVLLVWLPISVAIFVLVLALTNGISIFAGKVGIKEVKSLVYAISATLIGASLPPAIKYRLMARRQRGLVRSVADFLRDVSEVRKTGLSPEKCIILVSSRSYKNLTPIIERAAASLSLGLNLEEALRKALKGVKEWFVIASLRFLTDSILVGGGAPDVIDTLARFTQVLSELEEETRRRMRSQVVLPYLGAVLLASTPMIILYMLLSLARIPIATVTPLLLVLSLGSLINSYIMGLIAGKASQATMAAGFQHAIVLTLVTVLTLSVTFTFIGV
ncbi:MAG: type II secretion system F family protein [Desulfurococcaceae archaeon]